MWRIKLIKLSRETRVLFKNTREDLLAEKRIYHGLAISMNRIIFE